MTKKELYEELRKHNYRKTYPEVFAAAYNLALDHAAEKAKIQEDYLHPKINGQTRFICKSSAHNLRFTQDNTVSTTVNKESILNLKITE